MNKKNGNFLHFINAKKFHFFLFKEYYRYRSPLRGSYSSYRNNRYTQLSHGGKLQRPLLWHAQRSKRGKARLGCISRLYITLAFRIALSDARQSYCYRNVKTLKETHLSRQRFFPALFFIKKGLFAFIISIKII